MLQGNENLNSQVRQPGKRSNSRRYCCVKDCHSREGQHGVSLYRFPGRKWEHDRRKKWIAAVRRLKDSDGSDWAPSAATRICSKHFVGGEKSSLASHPGYCPTIFPAAYKARPVNSTARVSRYKRWHKRNSGAPDLTEKEADCVSDAAADLECPVDCSDSGSVPQPVCNEAHNLELLCAVAEASRQKHDQGCQTEDDSTLEKTFSIFISASDGNYACTQISHKAVCDAEIQCSPPMVSRHSGSDYRTSCFTGYESVKSCASAVKDLCGVTMEVFALLLSLLTARAERSCDPPLSDKLLLFLMKLKLGISYSSLAVLFCVNRTTASRHFNSILRSLSTATQKWIYRPPSSVIQARLPDSFKLHYPRCSMIIDCTEVRTEQPSTVEQQRALYSHYKGSYTVKFLIAITPCGTICFHSEAHGGRCSDAFITVNSGFLDLVQPGDTILADKGFPGIQAGLDEAEAVLVMPPFLHGQGQFTESEVQQTYHIAQVRIHVERMIQRIKLFNILNVQVPTELLPAMSDVVHMCCILANLQPPILKPNENDKQAMCNAAPTVD